jgi:hypothetical protein
MFAVQIIIIYAMDYKKLNGVGEMVAVQSVACFYDARTHRAAHYAQEVCSAESTEEFQVLQHKLSKYTDSLKYLHYTLVLGINAKDVTGMLMLRYAVRGRAQHGPPVFEPHSVDTVHASPTFT